MDLLLDVNIVIDICQPRQLFAPLALKALARCHAEGGRMWVYTGSVQTLEYSLARGLIHQAASRKNVLSDGKPGNGIMTF